MKIQKGSTIRTLDNRSLLRVLSLSEKGAQTKIGLLSLDYLVKRAQVWNVQTSTWLTCRYIDFSSCPQKP